MIKNFIATVAGAFELISPGIGRATITVVCLSILATLLEILGISLILAVLTSLIIGKNGAIGEISGIIPIDFILNYPVNNILVFTGLSFVLKGGILLFIKWWLAKFINENEGIFANNLFKLYVKAPYSLISKYNTAHINQKVQQFTSIVFSGVAMSFLMLLSNIIMAIGVFALLLRIDHSITLASVLFVSILGPIYLRVTGPIIKRIGKSVTQTINLFNKILLETIHARKEVRIHNSEDFFISNFSIPRMEYAKMRHIKSFIQQSTGIYFEIFAVTALLILLAIMLEFYDSKNTVIILGTFAAAISRLMGYANIIINSINQIGFGHAAVTDLLNDVKYLEVLPPETKLTPVQNLDFKLEINLQNITFSHEKNKNKQIKKLNIKIKKNTIVAFSGPSGTGKSTLVDLISGLLSPDEGDILCDGVNINTNIVNWRSKIGYVPQDFYMLDTSIRQNIAFGLDEDDIDDEKIWAAMKLAHIDDFVKSLPMEINTVVGDQGNQLSGGQKQRLAIARALYHEPQILLLDEATSALDPITEEELLNDVIKLKDQLTIILVTHRVAAAEKCDLQYFLANGSAMEVSSTPEVL